MAAFSSSLLLMFDQFYIDLAAPLYPFLPVLMNTKSLSLPEVAWVSHLENKLSGDDFPFLVELC